MVDISKIGGYALPDKMGQGKSPKPETSFSNVLEQAQKGQAADVAPAGALAPPMALQPVAGVEDMAASQADRLLNLLDKYSQALENPGVSLKSMGSMVEEMELEASAAKRILSRMDAREGIGGIVRQAAVYASVEAFKFRRGDYVE